MNDKISVSLHFGTEKNAIKNINDLKRIQIHNEREIKNNRNKDIKKELNKENEIIVGSKNVIEDVKKLYIIEFQSAVDEYNEKQKRKDRKIFDYFNEVEQNKQKQLAKEVILQIGDKSFWENKTLTEKKKMSEVFKNTIKHFEDNNLKIANCTVHFDETSPHAHLVIVPVHEKDKSKKYRGLSKEVSTTQVLNLEEFKRIIPEIREQFLKNFNKAFGVNYLMSESEEKRDYLSVKDYKNRELKKEEIVKFLEENNLKNDKKISEMLEKYENAKSLGDKIENLISKKKSLTVLDFKSKKEFENNLMLECEKSDKKIKILENEISKKSEIIDYTNNKLIEEKSKITKMNKELKNIKDEKKVLEKDFVLERNFLEDLKRKSEENKKEEDKKKQEIKEKEEKIRVLKKQLEQKELEIYNTGVELRNRERAIKRAENYKKQQEKAREELQKQLNQIAEDLQKLLENIEKNQKEIEENTKKYEELQEELKDKDNKLKELEKEKDEYNSYKAEINDLKNSADIDVKDFEEMRLNTMRELENLKQISEEIKIKNDNIENFIKSVEEKQEDLKKHIENKEKLEKEISNVESMIKFLQKEKGEKIKQSSEITNFIYDFEKEIDKNKEKYKKYKDEKEEYTKYLKDEKSLLNSVYNLKNSIKDLSEEKAKVEKEEVDKTNEIKEKRTKLENMKKELDTKRIEITSKNDELKTINDKLNNINNELNIKKEEVEKVKKELEDINKNDISKYKDEILSKIERDKKEFKDKKDKELEDYKMIILTEIGELQKQIDDKLKMKKKELNNIDKLKHNYENFDDLGDKQIIEQIRDKQDNSLYYDFLDKCCDLNSNIRKEVVKVADDVILKYLSSNEEDLEVVAEILKRCRKEDFEIIKEKFYNDEYTATLENEEFYNEIENILEKGFDSKEKTTIKGEQNDKKFEYEF